MGKLADTGRRWFAPKIFTNEESLLLCPGPHSAPAHTAPHAITGSSGPALGLIPQGILGHFPHPSGCQCPASEGCSHPSALALSSSVDGGHFTWDIAFVTRRAAGGRPPTASGWAAFHIRELLRPGLEFHPWAMYVLFGASVFSSENGVNNRSSCLPGLWWRLDEMT